jgi:hypothetical protein
MNQYYAELCESDFKTLSTLKQLIESHSKYSIIYQEALFEYRDFLVETINDFNDPLPPELEIDQDLLPQEYIDFKIDYSNNGPYKIKNFFNYCEAVYLIEVLSVSRKSYGFKMSAKILKSYKSTTNDANFCFICSTSQGPRFKKLEVAIIFLPLQEERSDDNYPNYYSHNYENKIEIIQRGDSTIALSPTMHTSFWNGLEFVKKEHHVEIDFLVLNAYLESFSP